MGCGEQRGLPSEFPGVFGMEHTTVVSRSLFSIFLPNRSLSLGQAAVLWSSTFSPLLPPSLYSCILSIPNIELFLAMTAPC